MGRISRTLVPLLVCIAVGVPAARGATPSAADFVSLAEPGALTRSADGRYLAYTISRAVRDSAATPKPDDTQAGWKRTRWIELRDLVTGTTRILTTGDDRPGSPRFSPDGHTLAFMRRGGIWLLPLEGGEARRLDTGKLAPESFRFSPDGRAIAFTASAARSDAEVEHDWRAGGAFEWESQWRRSRIWIVPVEGGAWRAASPDTLHIADFEWSPDGNSFAALTTRSSDPYEVFSVVQPRVLAAGDGHVVATLEWKAGSYGQVFDHLTWTPDSKRVLLTGLNGGLSNMNALLVWDVTSGTVRDIAPNRDLTLEGLVLLSGGGDVIAVQTARTETRFLRFSIAGGASSDAGFSRRAVVGAVSADAAGHSLIFLSSTPSEPVEITEFDLTTRRTRLITHLHPEIGGWSLGSAEVVRWKNPEGVELEGVLTRPPGATGATPLIVLPHGGPDGVTQQSFSSQVQYFATHGYAVFQPNYRGGTGYGFAFYEANRNRFGTIEQMDIESGVDNLIARKLVDPARLFYGGWSWGGYLSAWTLGHVQRYKAFVVGAGVNDVSFSYTSSDINHGVAAQWEYRGNPWEQTDHFDRANPIRYVKDMKTPTLILHGQADDRVHFLNGLMLYRALTDVGTEVSLIAYPREPHGFQEPAHVVHRLETWTRWYDQHGGASSSRP